MGLDEISVRILGPIEIVRDGRAIPLRARRERAVVALLVVHGGRSVPVDRMADDLWEGEPPSSAVTSLRAHVSRVRKALSAGGVEDLVVTNEAGYALRLDSVRLDAAEFERSAGRGRALLADGCPEQAAVTLAEALELWRGGPFGDLGHVAFARAETARLEESFRVVREDRIDADLLCGRHRELTAELEALVADEPLRERLWGQRMLALYRSGRQAEALRAYGGLRTVLADTLGISPSPALQQLEVSMLCQDPMLDLPHRAEPVPAMRPPRPVAPSPVAAPGPPAPLPDELRAGECDGRFVGRAAEVGVLRAAWGEAMEGLGQRVFIAGEPGIGKTTLAGCLAKHAHELGGVVLLGRCDADALTPYQPFVEALRRYVASCRESALDRLPQHALAEVARLVPDLAERAGRPEVATADPGDADRFSLFEGVTTFLTSIAADHPMLLVLEDLHWADKPTSLLLRHFVRRAPHANVMVLGTYRDVDISPAHPLTEVLADLRREHAVQRLPLRGLDEQAVTSLIEAMVEEDVGTTSMELAGSLQRETGGNPFFLREVIRHLQATSGSPAGWSRDIEAGTAGIPESVREVVGRRVSSLGSIVGPVLTLGAVVGDRFDVDSVCAVGELDELEVIDALDEASAAGLVVEVHGRPGWYEFAHALIREVLYSSLSTVRRLRLHRAVGEALETRSGAEASGSRVLARHFLEAGSAGDAPAKAIRHCLGAGLTAMDQLAYEEAISFLERGLEVHADLEAPEPRSRIDLLLALGSAQWRAGASAVRQTFKRAAVHAEAIGDETRFAMAVVGMGLDAGGFASSVRANPELIAAIEQALDALGPGDGELRVRLLSRLAVERYFTPERALGQVHGEEALAIADRLGVPRVRLVALHAIAWATFAPGSPPDLRLGQAADIVALAEEVGDREMAYRGEVLRLQTLLEIGDLVSAEACGERMERLVDELRMPRFAPWVRSCQATRAFLAGELKLADRLAAEALADAVERGADTEAALALIGGQQMAVRIYRDGIEPFVDALQTMADELAAQAVVRAMLPVLFQELNRPADAARAYKEAVAVRDEVPHDATWLIYAWALGVSCRFGEGRESAEELYDQLLPYAERWAVSTPSICMGPIAQALAGYASVIGWHDAALAHCETALTKARNAPSPVFEAVALVEQAQAFLARDETGDRDRAQQSLHEAAHLSIAIGLTALLERIQRMLATVR